MGKQRRVTVAEMNWVADHLDRKDPEASAYWRELARAEEARLRQVPVVTSARYRMGRPFGVVRA
jgi:hypothetical protein